MSGPGKEQVFKSNCCACHGGCGVLVHVVDGRITRIEGNPDFPSNYGSMCPRGMAYPQLVYHPDRLHYPVKRSGNKGEGKWERITWDEAFDTIADRYKKIIPEYGAESIVLGYGTGRNYENFLYRFSNLLGTPNVITAGHMCYGPRIAASNVLCGNMPVSDFDNNPECVMVWGNNVVISNGDEYCGENLSRVLSNGAKLIVVDPKLTYLAGRADIWLQLRPGTDVALALGMANIIIEEGLYDREFVGKYIHGWDKYVARAKEYTPEKVQEITWIREDRLRAAARLYASTKPACIQWGVGIEQSINTTDNVRSLLALMAMTGNLDAQGGNVFNAPPPIMAVGKFSLHAELSPEQKAKRLGGDLYKLADRIQIITPKVVWDAILKGNPYPIKAVQLHGTNPIITRANAAEVYKALKSVEFLVVADFFMTPTAELADIVLPASNWLEFNDIGDYWKRQSYVYPRPKIVQIGECRSNHEMFMELGKRLGQGDYWHATPEEDLDEILEPSGMKWEEFRKLDYLKNETKYKKYEWKGFSTPTKKVELYSTVMEKWGYDPLPKFREVPESPKGKPEMAESYPYILSTGARAPAFYCSEHRMIPWLRELNPDPIVEIHPDTAGKHGIKDGDWVFIESPRGRIKQRARLTAVVDPRVVAIQYGWWFPEIKTPDHGWDKSNSNIITDNDPTGYDAAMGATNLRTLMCRISPARDES